MPKQTYEFDLVAKVEEATAAIKSFSSATQKQLDSLNFKEGVTAFVEGFRLIEDIGKEAFHVITEALGEFIDKAKEAEESETKLINALRLTGDLSQEANEHFEAFASSIEQTTRFSKEQVESSLAIAKQYKLTNEESERAVRTATDLAGVLGIDLESATTKIGRSFNGFVDRDLGRSITGMKSLSQQSLLAGGALSVIEKATQGTAAALGNTFTGEITKASNAFDKIQVTLGEFVTKNPEVIAIIEEIRKSFVNFNNVLKDNSKQVTSLITQGFLFIIQSAPSVVAAVQGIGNAFADISAGAQKAGLVLSVLPELLQSTNLDNTKKILSGIGEEFDAINKSAENIKNGNAAFFDPLIKAATELADKATKAAQGAKNLDVALGNIGGSNTGFGARLAASITPEIIRKRVEDALKTPFSLVLTAQVRANLKIEDAFSQQLIAGAVGFTNQILKGAAGAQALVSNTIGEVADAIVPGIGGAVGEIVNVLGQGPEKVKEMVNQFVQALPVIIKNIIIAIPALINALIDAIPQFIDALVAGIPDIIQALVQALPVIGAKLAALMPEIALNFATSLIHNIPNIVEGFSKEFLKIPEEFLKSLTKNLPGLGGGGGGGGGLLSKIPVIGGALSSFGDAIGLADGGEIPDTPQNSNDHFPVRTSGGENVIDRSTNKRLKQFLNDQDGRAPTSITVNWVVDRQVLATVLLNLDRDGYRTAAT